MRLLQRFSLATMQGTLQYSKTNPKVHPDNFKPNLDNTLLFPSIGLGSYLGSPFAEDDEKLFNMIFNLIHSGGSNLIDTAINYRYQRSERAIGQALQQLFLNYKQFKREQIIVCSKGGYLEQDGYIEEQRQS